MAAGKSEKGFRRRGAMGKIGLDEPLHGLRRIFRLDVAKNLLPDVSLRSETAAGKDVIALDRVVLGGAWHLRREQTDVADVVLRAGMVAAGEMDVERGVDLDARITPVADRGGMALGVGGREFAALVAGAGDEAR